MTEQKEKTCSDCLHFFAGSSDPRVSIKEELSAGPLGRICSKQYGCELTTTACVEFQQMSNYDLINLRLQRLLNLCRLADGENILTTEELDEESQIRKSQIADAYKKSLDN